MAKEMGLKCEERRVSIQEVYEAHAKGELLEVFGSGTAAVISPVGELNWAGNIININDGKTGPVAAVKVVRGDEDVLAITDDATIIRISVDRISQLSRATQGVRIMRLAEGSRIISIETTEKEPVSEEAAADAELVVIDETAEEVTGEVSEE
jgi:hypothetical protein